MDGFNWIDAAVIAVIVVSAILAWSRGLVREAMSIAGWVIAAIVAFAFAAQARPLMQEIPVIGERLRGSCELSVIAAFVVVFLLALLVVSIFTPLLSGAIRDSALGTVDQGLGFLFGVARGVLLIAVAMLVYDRVAVADPVEAVELSRTNAIYTRSADRIDGAVPENAPGWIVGRYEELVGICER